MRIYLLFRVHPASRCIRIWFAIAGERFPSQPGNSPALHRINSPPDGASLRRSSGKWLSRGTNYRETHFKILFHHRHRRNDARSVSSSRQPCIFLSCGRKLRNTKRIVYPPRILSRVLRRRMIAPAGEGRAEETSPSLARKEISRDAMQYGIVEWFRGAFRIASLPVQRRDLWRRCKCMQGRGGRESLSCCHEIRIAASPVARNPGETL